jgi:HEPN domain-containing protein
MSGNELRHDVASWVRKAELDRGIALSIDRLLFSDGVCFHCQQCIEKYLKAVLVAHDEVPERIHDLVVLGTEASDHCPRIAEVLDDLSFLNPFSVLIRYPEKDTDPGEAEEAMEVMERVRAVLREALGIEEPEANAEGEAEERGSIADNNTTGE